MNIMQVVAKWPVRTEYVATLGLNVLLNPQWSSSYI